MIDLTKLEWIEINLPWYFHDDGEGRPEFPNLDKREEQVFGISLVEAEKDVKEDLEKFSQLLNELRELQDEARRVAVLNGVSYSDFIISSEYDAIEQEFWKQHRSDPCVIARDAYKDLQERVFTWSDEQPEWKAHSKAIEEYNALQDLKSFSGRKLNQPGTIIELENGQIELIGSINRSTGVCNDCPAFDDDSIVKKYAVVFQFTRREANDERSDDNSE